MKKKNKKTKTLIGIVHTPTVTKQQVGEWILDKCKNKPFFEVLKVLKFLDIKIILTFKEKKR